MVVQVVGNLLVCPLQLSLILNDGGGLDVGLGSMRVQQVDGTALSTVFIGLVHCIAQAFATSLLRCQCVHGALSDGFPLVLGDYGEHASGHRVRVGHVSSNEIHPRVLTSDYATQWHTMDRMLLLAGPLSSSNQKVGCEFVLKNLKYEQSKIVRW